MKDHFYSKNTRTTYHNVDIRLSKKGYKLTSYGDDRHDNGYAYYEKGESIIKVTYLWIPNPNGLGVIADKMISIEDYS